MRHCSIKDCIKPVKARELCAMHLSRLVRHGDANYQPEWGKCAIDGCEGSLAGHGYCRKHYKKWRRWGDPLHIMPPRPVKPCSVEGCDNKHRSNSFCKKHNSRFKKWGDPYKVGHIKHGLYGSPIYRVWNHMRQRCENPKFKQYLDYGGRGITVCGRWRDSFQFFYDDMSPRPKGMTLERINNDLNYSCGKCGDCIAKGWPANCRWATRFEQSMNRRKYRNNKCGFRGVYFSRGRWVAALRGKCLGRFGTPEEASIAYECARTCLLDNHLAPT